MESEIRPSMASFFDDLFVFGKGFAFMTEAVVGESKGEEARPGCG